MVVSHSLFYIYLFHWICSWPPLLYFYFGSATISAHFRSFLEFTMYLLAQDLWLTQLNLVPSNRDATWSLQISSNVLCILPTDILGSGIPSPPRLILYPSISCILLSTSPPQKIMDKNFLFRDLSMYHTSKPTSEIVFFRYFNLIYSKILSPE